MIGRPFRFPGHIGGIERPRALTACGAVAVGRGGAAEASTGVVSISKRSFGVHCRAVHNAISVDSLI